MTTGRALQALAVAGVLMIEGGLAAAPAYAQAFDYRAPRGPALGRVSPTPPISSQRAAPAYRLRREPVCTIRVVRDRFGDVVRRVRTCRDPW